jgi:hypothetical protein
LVEKLIECALAGDLVAMKLCLERGWGVPVRTAVPIALQPTTNAHEVRQAMHAVFDRVAAGELDLESAASLIVSYRHLLATYDNMSVPMLQGASVMDARTQLAARFQRAIEARQRETGTEPPPPADQYVAISSPAGPPNSADAAPASTTTDNDAARNARLAQMLRSTIEHLEQQQQQED